MSRFLSIGLGMSLLAHGAAYAALEAAPHRVAPRPAPSKVEFEVAARHPAPPPAPSPSPKPTPSEPAPIAGAAPVTKPIEPPPEPNPPAPAAPAPLDLSGLTLTNDSGEAGWSSPTGDGSSRQGPLGPIGTKGKASGVPQSAQPVVVVHAARQVPALVAVSDLSEKPRPPALDAALREHYPPEARMRAISGNASLRVRIDADGRVRSALLLSETFEGFGNACRRALLGSRWSPPRDENGRAVATEVRYTCRFLVD